MEGVGGIIITERGREEVQLLAEVELLGFCRRKTFNMLEVHFPGFLKCGRAAEVSIALRGNFETYICAIVENAFFEG